MPDTTLVIHAKNLTKEAISQLKADLDSTTRSLQEQGKLTTEISEKNKQTTQSYTGLTIALGATAAGLGLLTRSIVTAAMTQQKLMMGLAAVEGGAKGAEQAMKRLQEVAKLPGLNLQQATQGYIQLRSIDMNASLAERSLKAFGNALVTVGKGAPELSLVTLALTQMSAKGKVLGQDLRQLQEQLPQIRKVMKQAFGTADVEAVQKILEDTGQTADQFIEKMVEGFEKLPKVTGGAANAVENFNDVMFRTKAQLGEALLPYLIKVLDTVSSLAESFNKLSPATKGAIGTAIAGGAGIAGLAFAAVGLAKVIPEIVAGIQALSGAMVAGNTATGIFATGLSGVMVQLGAVAFAAASVVWAVKQIHEALTQPIDLKLLNQAANKQIIDQLNKAKSALEKQMTKAGASKTDYIDIDSTMAVRKIYPIKPLTTVEDALKRINQEIDKFSGKSDKIQATFVEKPMSIVKGWDEVKKTFDELTDITSAGFGMSSQAQLSYWKQILSAPQGLTEEAKRGIQNTIKQLRDEVRKETDKATKQSADARQKWLDKLKEDAEQGLRLALEQNKLEEETLSRIEDMRARDEAIGKQTREVIDPITGLPMSEVQKALEFRDKLIETALKKRYEMELYWANMATQLEERDLKTQLAIPAKNEDYDPITGLRKSEIEQAFKFREDLEKQAAEEREKAFEKAIKLAEKHRDEQLKIYQDMADSIGSVFAQIPADLIKNFDDIGQVLKNLLNGILNSVVNTIGKGIGTSISNALTGQTQAGGIGDIIKAITSMIGIVGGVATGNPMAVIGGASSLAGDWYATETIAPMIGGMSFDDPMNDLMALSRGKTASYKLGHKSAKDMLDNFTVGFEGGASAISGRSGDPELHGLLKEVLSELRSGNKYEFFLDGDPIAATVRKKTNKKTSRGEWA